MTHERPERVNYIHLTIKFQYENKPKNCKWEIQNGNKWKELNDREREIERKRTEKTIRTKKINISLTNARHTIYIKVIRCPVANFQTKQCCNSTYFWVYWLLRIFRPFFIPRRKCHSRSGSVSALYARCCYCTCPLVIRFLSNGHVQLHSLYCSAFLLMYVCFVFVCICTIPVFKVRSTRFGNLIPLCTPSKKCPISWMNLGNLDLN